MVWKNSEEENIAHGKDILPFQLDFSHMRFERRGEYVCVRLKSFVPQLRYPGKVLLRVNVFIGQSCDFSRNALLGYEGEP